MQQICWSLRCSWSIACRRCSNYTFILHLTTGFNILHKGSCKTRRETFKFSYLVRLISDIWRYMSVCYQFILFQLCTKSQVDNVAWTWMVIDHHTHTSSNVPVNSVTPSIHDDCLMTPHVLFILIWYSLHCFYQIFVHFYDWITTSTVTKINAFSHRQFEFSNVYRE